jgi:uncharacterized repeat protein (TIGR03803 family)
MSEIRSKSDLIDSFDAAGDPAAIDWTSGGFRNAKFVSGAMTKSPRLTTLASFTGGAGTNPFGDLITDAAGDLFGTASEGGADDYGTVFEIAMTRHGYGSVPTALFSFTGADGQYPEGSLIADATGDLFGTTVSGGVDNDGTVFEIARTKHGYAGAPTTLFSFTGADGSTPDGGLIADAAGDLFGTTYFGGADDEGTVFEIARTKDGYAGAPTTLVGFTRADGAQPNGSLIADGAGDLFGTTSSGGADDDGTVFEIAKTKTGYAGAPTTVVSFTGADGMYPLASLIADAAGDLFGTTSAGGDDGDGTVFEITRTNSGYAKAATTLVSFTNTDGAQPDGSLIADAAGDLFGTTTGGGANGDGTVFEITKTRHGYASAPTTLASFTGADGTTPSGSLLADAAGDFFGTTLGGGAYTEGTVFELAKVKGGYAFVQAMATTGHREAAGLFNCRINQESHQPMVATPRFAIA